MIIAGNNHSLHSGYNVDSDNSALTGR